MLAKVPMGGRPIQPVSKLVFHLLGVELDVVFEKTVPVNFVVGELCFSASKAIFFF